MKNKDDVICVGELVILMILFLASIIFYAKIAKAPKSQPIEYVQVTPADYDYVRDELGRLKNENVSLKNKLNELEDVIATDNDYIEAYRQEITELNDMLDRVSLTHDVRLTDVIALHTNVNWVFDEEYLIKDVNDYRNSIMFFINDKSVYAKEIDEYHFYYETEPMFICWYKVCNVYIEFQIPTYDRSTEELIDVFMDMTNSIEVEAG